MGAYENPKLIIQDHLAFQRAFDAKMQPALESYAKAVEAKKLREEEAERLLQQRIDVTTAGLYGTIENLGRSSQATKDNIKNNVNDFVMYAQENKLTANRLLEFKNNWKNSTDPYNDLLNQSIGGNVNISKGHEHYDEYIEMVTAVKNGAIFDNKFNRDTGNFEGVLTYQVNGKTVTKNAEQINIVLNGVSGAAENFSAFEKDYKTEISDDRSIAREIVGAELTRIFNNNKGLAAATDDEIEGVLNTTYTTISANFDDDFKRDIWYNKMKDNDKILNYTDSNGKKQQINIDWKLTDEHFYKIADANSDGKLSEEELKVQEQLINGRESLLKKFITDQLRVGAKSKRVLQERNISPSDRQKRNREIAYQQYDYLSDIDISMIKDPSKMGPDDFQLMGILPTMNGIFPNFDAQKATIEQKREGYATWMTQKLNDLMVGDKLKTRFYTASQMKNVFFADKIAEAEINGKDVPTNKELEVLWSKTDLAKKKVTPGDGIIYYTTLGEGGKFQPQVLQTMNFNDIMKKVLVLRKIEFTGDYTKPPAGQTEPPLN